MLTETAVIRRCCASSGAAIAFGVLVLGCGQSPAVKQFQQQIAQTRQQCKAAEVRRAVFLLQARWDDPNRGFVPVDQWPKEIRDIALFQDDVGDLHPMIFPSSSGKDALGLVAGSGFGHWGIIVCSDTNSVPKTEGTVVPWEVGVFFWLE